MKVLMLTPYLPFPLITGGQTRSFNLIKRLSGLGHEITLFCLIKSDNEKQYTGELSKYCKDVRVFRRPQKPWTLGNVLRTGFSLFPFLVIRNFSAQEKKAVAEILKGGNFDIIHAETFYVYPHIPETHTPVVLVDQTIEYEVYRHYVEKFKFLPLRPLLYLDVGKIKYWETYYWEKARKVIAMSYEDRKIMLSQNPKLNVDIVPNGVDYGSFAKKIAQRSKSPVILYLGNFTWLQNREAAGVLINKIWPKIKKEFINAKLWIIGKDAEKFFPNVADSEIRVEQVEDPRLVYQCASLLVAPLYGGGGTRYKNFEAFASGLPVVTTSIGIGGTDARDGEEVIIRDTPDKIAQAAIELLKNKKLYEKIARNAKKLVRRKYDWGPIADKLNKLYEEVAHA